MICEISMNLTNTLRRILTSILLLYKITKHLIHSLSGTLHFNEASPRKLISIIYDVFKLHEICIYFRLKDSVQSFTKLKCLMLCSHIRNSTSNYVLNYVIRHTKFSMRITEILCNSISITMVKTQKI